MQIHHPARRHRRTSCWAAALLENGNVLLGGRCEDISLGGAFIRGVRLPAGWQGNLFLTLSGRTLKMPVIAKSNRAGGTGGTGVQFSQLSMEALAVLASFIGFVPHVDTPLDLSKELGPLLTPRSRAPSA
jgi:hypothetical protein